MSKIKELKKSYPLLTRSFIDVVAEIIPIKYLETYLRISYDKFVSDRYNYFYDIRSELLETWNLPESFVSGKTQEELVFEFGLLDMFTSRNNMDTILQFAELNEKKLIKNNDLRSYKTFTEMDLQISISQLKLFNKELEKEIETVYEDEEWKLLKPLSWLASKKYGAGTRWCTSMEKDSSPFVRYSKRGVLIYCINKKTGLKVAGFKSLDIESEKETSFWNSVDQRIDSMESNLPDFILNIFRKIFLETKKTNWELFNDESKNIHFAMIKKMEEDDDIDTPRLRTIGELEHELTRPIRTPFNQTNWEVNENNTNIA